MKTFLSIFTFFIAVSCAAQSPNFPHAFTVTLPDSAYLAEMSKTEVVNSNGSMGYDVTKWKQVIPDSAFALSLVLSKYTQINFYPDEIDYDVEEWARNIYEYNLSLPLDISYSDDSPQWLMTYFVINPQGRESRCRIPVELVSKYLQLNN